MHCLRENESGRKEGEQEMTEMKLIWFRERDTPEDELVQEIAFHGNGDGTLTLSIASFEKLLSEVGYERIEGRN